MHTRREWVKILIYRIGMIDWMAPQQICASLQSYKRDLQLPMTRS